MIDGLGGIAVAPPHRATTFATTSLRGASWPPALEQRVARFGAELAVCDEAARSMRVEPGAYEVRVGPDSERTPLRASFTVR
jgi:hypothetical protein